jgi:Predicted Zn peptidase
MVGASFLSGLTVSSTLLFNKMLQCFILARRVNHYYWVHTTGDDDPGATSVENIQKIVSRMSGMHIRKRVVDFEGSTLRGNEERFDNKVMIHVRASLSTPWRRFTVVKELCHVLLDDAEDFSTDVVTTIRDLLQFTGFNGKESAEIRSEKLAEIMAVELMYPIEFRRGDKAALQAGAKIGDLAEKRQIPPIWIERALGDGWLEACELVWATIKNLPDDVTPLGPEVPDPGDWDEVL